MITLVTAWISERIITVTTMVVVAIAAVPTTLVLVSHNQAAVSVQQVQRQRQLELVANLKKSGDTAITRLTAAEQGCTVQLDQTVAAAHVPPGQVQSQLARAHSQVRASAAPLIAQIQRHENDFARLESPTPEEEQREEQEIDAIVLVALGDGQTPGTITVTCQTVTLVIQEVIQVIVLEQEVHVVKPEGDDD
jgi:hypothetical protein